MKIVQINTTCGVGSTGKICEGISGVLTANHVENYILYSSKTDGYPLGIGCSDDRYIKIQALKSRIFGNYGFNSRRATAKIIGELDRIRPDIVHLHNIHGHDCHLGLLFDYLRQRRIKVVWTFHDCWVFTGYCPHFTMVRCGKWREGCRDCVQRREYSWFFDRSRYLYEEKKRALEGSDLTIVTPSAWLKGLVGQSFLQHCPVQVIHNGIDLGVFRPTGSDFRSRYGLEGKKIVLGVSFDWGAKKGLDVFVELARRLPDDYRIVLIGTDDATDRQLPDNVVSIRRTQDQRELAGIYTAADVLMNPTREENFPTVNMEALACGTPVVTFRTGGSPEMLDPTCGSVVDCGDVDAMEREIRRVCGERPYSEQQCTSKALEFDKNDRYKEYLKLYERIITSGMQRD